MRIALDCRAAFKGMGGIGRYTWCLLQEYAALEAEHDFFCYFTHLEPPGLLDLPSRFVVKHFQAGMIDERFDQLILPTLLEQDKIDLYHNPVFAAPIIKTRARCIATVHDVVFKRHPELVEPRLARYLDKATARAARSADSILTVSEYSKKEIASLYKVPEKRITVIPNGITLPGREESRSSGIQALQQLDLESGEYLLYVGSLEPKKNIKGLLEAFEAVLKRLPHPKLKLALVGSAVAADYPVAEWAKAPGLKGRVVIPGYVSDDLLGVLYRSAMLFVYPSFYEGFGIPPLEAMARGVPTIVSSASSLPEVVGEDGVCVDPHRPDLLAEAISDLISDPRRREDLSERGRKRAFAYTWKQSAIRHLELYDSLGVNRHEDIASRV